LVFACGCCDGAWRILNSDARVGRRSWSSYIWCLYNIRK
jgi:hypothetical protein